MVISQFTDAYTARGAYNMDRLKCSSNIIEEILSSWTGLFYFCVDNRQSIYAIVEALSLPSTEVQNMLIHTLSGLFRSLPVNSPCWILQFSCLRLMLFVDAGLVEALVQAATGGEASTCELIFPLLSDILTMCARYLPKEYNDRVQGLPQLFTSASDFKNELNRHVVQNRLSKVFQTHSQKLEVPKDPQTTDLQKETSRFRLILAIEDHQMQGMILDSEVLGLKDHTKWNWDVISELVQCAATSPAKLDVLVRITKFIPRILIFLKPSSKQFCDIAVQTPESGKVVKVCSELLCILASTEYGRKVLAEHRVIFEVGEKLQRLVDPSNMDMDNIFSKERMESTLSREYFTFLGALQQTQVTRYVLRECALWTTYYALIELRGRDDIAKRILMTGNYYRDGHMRVILSKLLVAGYKEMRLFTTQWIDTLLDFRDDSICEWVAPLLMPQLFDAAPQVIESALQVIKKGCTNPAFLNTFIQSNPDIDHIAQHDTEILFHFLQTENGFSEILQNGFLHNEIKYWVEEGLVEYALYFERRMTATSTTALTIPTHLYGSLVSTLQGCTFLKTHGQLEILFVYLQYTPTELESEENISKLKSSIWGLCHACSTTFGIDLIDTISEGCCVKRIVDVALHSSVLSVRGVAWHALSLLGRSLQGKERLAQFDISANDLFCLPNSTSQITVSFINVDVHMGIYRFMAK
jgi:rapamycin-insensitive companion of mTOR